MLRVAVLAPINSIPETGECEQFLNLQRACVAATDLVNLGVAPFVPNLAAIWHMLTPLPQEFWVQWTRSFIEACDAVFVLARSRSAGVESHADFARQLGLPVFTDLAELAKWAAQRSARANEVQGFGLSSYESEIARAEDVAARSVPAVELGEFPAEEFSRGR